MVRKIVLSLIPPRKFGFALLIGQTTNQLKSEQIKSNVGFSGEGKTSRSTVDRPSDRVR